MSEGNLGKCKKWHIVGFNHPTDKHSIEYKQNVTKEKLFETIQKGIDLGCNLFSIRGFAS